MSDKENHQHCTQQFIDLANTLKKEGFEPQLISASLMSATAIYATYVSAGNEGGLQPSGVDKVVMMFRRNLEHIQERKKEEMEARDG
ncbi:MAG: DUF3144 domain-containing protein [Xanthomonadales bacterium]|nr:DUF3144 domain-containing protein [Xanthomonadales bacterium]